LAISLSLGAVITAIALIAAFQPAAFHGRPPKAHADSGTVTFTNNGTYQVPAYSSTIHVDVIGQAGKSPVGASSGGRGEEIVADIPVTPGSTLYVGAGWFLGCGNLGSTASGGDGGGTAYISTTQTPSPSSLLVIAGGGGGGGGGGLYGGGGGDGSSWGGGGGGGGSSYLTSSATLDSNGLESDSTASVTITPVLPILLVLTFSVDTTYGTAPSFNPIYLGFIHGDTAASLTSPATCIGVDASGNPLPLTAPVGTYHAACSGAVDPNYNIEYSNTYVYIDPAPLTITPNPQTMPYGGVAQPFTASY
jgi:hypothetical protein